MKPRSRKRAKTHEKSQRYVVSSDDPLGLATISNDKQTVVLDNYPNLLADLLSPGTLSVQDFLRFKFRKQAFYVPASATANKEENRTNRNARGSVTGSSGSLQSPRMQRIVEHLFDLDPKSILENTASENIFVWLPEKTPQKDSSQPSPVSAQKTLIRSIEVSDVDTALALFHSGHSTYCRAPPFLESLLVPALLENTGLGCGQYNLNSNNSLGRGEIEIFQSATPGQVTEWHYDFQENFTLQLSGRKKWTLQHSTIESPLPRAVTPHYASESVVEGQLLAARLATSMDDRRPGEISLFQFGPPNAPQFHNARGSPKQVIMNPGDVLYFPAGMWHKVEVLEPGVSLNISLMGTSYANLVCQSLQQLLLQRSPAWRQTVLTRHYEVQETPSVLDRLHHLLETDLPLALQDWMTKQGGAATIVPPILRQGQVDDPFHSPDDDSDDSQKSSGDETGDSEQSSKEKVIDMDSSLPPSRIDFDPSVKALQEKLRTHRLIRNPLASLIRSDDITRYYGGSKGQHTDDTETGNCHLYVLNFNFAGNEGLDSFVRETLSTTHKALDTVFLDESSADQLSTRIIMQSNGDNSSSVIAWLIYVGYLVWVSRSV